MDQRVLGALFASCLIGWVGHASADWPADGIRLPAPMPSMAPDDAGGVYYAYQAAGELWLGRLGSDGFERPGFPARVGGPGEYPAIAKDGAGGVFVVWQRDSADARWLVVSRVRTDGSLAWPVPLRIPRHRMAQRWLALAEGETRDLHVAWLEDRDGGHLVVVRVDSAGSIPAGWPCDRAEGFDDAYLVLQQDGAGGVVTAMHGDTLKLSRIDGSGHHLWSRAHPQNWFVHVGPHAVPDAAGGTYYARSYPNDGAIRLHHVASDGATVSGWPDTGIVVNDPARGVWLSDAALVPDGTGGVFVVFEVNDGFYHPNIACQRLRADGSIAPGWGPFGNAVVEAQYSQQSLVALSDGTGGVVVAWEDWRDRIWGTVAPYAQRLDASGVPAPGWPPSGVRLSATVYADLPSAVPDGTGGAFVMWYTGNSVEDPAWIQRVRGDGVVGPLLSGRRIGLRVSAPYPNPSAAVVQCDVDVSTDGPVVADVHDLGGRRVASLITPAHGGSGSHRLRWDGRDESGRPVPAGVYFLIVRTRTDRATARLAIIR